MRMHAIASILALSLSLALGSTAVAAPTASSSVEITANVQFNSILGGSAYGVATLSGDLSGDELGALRGTVNLPLHDEKITVEPTASSSCRRSSCRSSGSAWSANRSSATGRREPPPMSASSRKDPSTSASETSAATARSVWRRTRPASARARRRGHSSGASRWAKPRSPVESRALRTRERSTSTARPRSSTEPCGVMIAPGSPPGAICFVRAHLP